MERGKNWSPQNRDPLTDCQKIWVPIVKNQLDVTSSNNYRGITLSPLLSKFEHYILIKYSTHLFHVIRSLGLKRILDAVFVLLQYVEYFLMHGSTVYMAECTQGIWQG